MQSVISIGTFEAVPLHTRVERYIGDRLTQQRLRFLATAVICVGLSLLLFTFATAKDNRIANGLGLGGDYLAFYDAATILNQHQPQRLYDLDLQAQLYHHNLPGEADNVSLPFAYAPFLALVFRPLAMMPYAVSYAVWTTISGALFAAAFVLVWKSAGLPGKYLKLALLFALSFEPFVIECLHGGQISTIGLFFISLTIYLSTRRRPILAGLALSVCIYKPTLLPLLLMMLVLMRQWKTLYAFGVGTVVLMAVSFFSVGPVAGDDYLALLLSYANKTTSDGVSGLQTWKFVDLNSFCRLLELPPVVIHGLLLLVSAALTKQAWATRPRSAEAAARTLPLAWATAITWTLVLNVYVGVYDAILLIPSIVLMCGALLRRESDTGRNLPLRLRVMLVGVWMLPWFSQFSARDMGLQPFTLAIFALAAYQLNLLQARMTAIDPLKHNQRTRRIDRTPSLAMPVNASMA